MQPFSLLLKVRGVARAFFAAITLRVRREPGSGRPRLAVADDVDDGWVPPSPHAWAQHLDAMNGIVPAREEGNDARPGVRKLSRSLVVPTLLWAETDCT